MQILDAAATAGALPYLPLVSAIAEAARDLTQGRIRAPERLVVPAGNGVLLCMPAVASDLGVTKRITVHGDNPQQGLPAIQGEVTVFDAASGRPLVLLDGPTVTARRTAAVSLLGIERLLPQPPQSVVLIGTGVQALAHAQGLLDYFGVTRLHVAAREEGKARAFCDALAPRYPQTAFHPLAMPMLEQACTEADVVIALTTSRTPVIPASLPSRTLAVGVGAFKPEMAELPPALLKARPIVVDHLIGAQHEAGDLLQAGIDWNGVRELADLLEKAPPADAPVFKTVGHAAWDLAAARVAVQSL